MRRTTEEEGAVYFTCDHPGCGEMRMAGDLDGWSKAGLTDTSMPAGGLVWHFCHKHYDDGDAHAAGPTGKEGES